MSGRGVEGFSIRTATDLILSRSRHHGHPFFSA